MRLAVSNIAWPSGSDEIAASILTEHGATGVEIAPTKVWPRPLEATASEVDGYRRFWERQGLPIIALQALLFGRSDLTLFDAPETRSQTLEYLRGMIDLAARLGAEVLVFGSPRNRQAGTRPRAEVEAIAREAFGALGDFAHKRGVAFCIEPNPTAYQCDYITSAEQGANLVERVGSPGFQLHLDAGAMTLAGDSFASIFARVRGYWRHFHISEPNLAPIASTAVDHRALAAAAHRTAYDRWYSIEMKEVTDGRPWTGTLGASLELVRDLYFNHSGIVSCSA
jgi:sugar phosphate isomerase/epimerase